MTDTRKRLRIPAAAADRLSWARQASQSCSRWSWTGHAATKPSTRIPCRFAQLSAGVATESGGRRCQRVACGQRVGELGLRQASSASQARQRPDRRRLVCGVQPRCSSRARRRHDPLPRAHQRCVLRSVQCRWQVFGHWLQPRRQHLRRADWPEGHLAAGRIGR